MPLPLRGLAALLLVGGLAGCPQASSTAGSEGCDDCHPAGSSTHAGSKAHSSSTAKATGSSASAAGSSSASAVQASSGTASSGGGTTSNVGVTGPGGGSTSGGLGDGGEDAGIDCPDLFVAARVYDIGSNTALAGVVVSALGPNGIPIPGAQATSQADGTFVLCVPGDVEITPELVATGYPTTYLENFYLTESLTQFAGREGIPMASTEELTAFGAILGYSITGNAAVLAAVASGTDTAPCNKNAAGWTFVLNLPDGGVLPDGGHVPSQDYYFTPNDAPEFNLTATSSNGLALLLNVDTQVTSVVSIEATNPDAGPCNIDLAADMMTGRAYVIQGALTIAVLPTP